MDNWIVAVPTLNNHCVLRKHLTAVFRQDKSLGCPLSAHQLTMHCLSPSKPCIKPSSYSISQADPPPQPAMPPPGNIICVASKEEGGRCQIKTSSWTIVDTLIRQTTTIPSFTTLKKVLFFGNCGTHLRLLMRLTLHLISRSMKLFTVYVSASS
jgi:hypothetical protein